MKISQLSLIANTSSDYDLSTLYKKAHDMMRNVEGLQPQEAFDELLKFLFFKQANEERGPKIIAPTAEINSWSKDEIQQLSNSIRLAFSNYVDTFNSWFKELWKDQKFHLSDIALCNLYQIFSNVDFSQISFDIRSSALKEFLSPEMRRGMGIYLTPDDVVKMMVSFVNPKPSDAVYDLACGAGTFLIETLKLRQTQGNLKKNIVWGTDKNPRMLLLAELNLGHFSGVIFNRRVTDSLFPEINDNYQWPVDNSFDVIFTNPPFGVILDNSSYDLRKFNTCRTKEGYLPNRQQSEIVFIEQAINYLKAGGVLGIVLPKSVVTNSTFQTARKALDNQGYIFAAVVLPSETFATTGTQASTVVLFIKKYEARENKKEKIRIALANVTNVGYDATGRVRSGNQLSLLPENLMTCIRDQVDTGICRILPAISKDESFTEFGNLLAGKLGVDSTLKLRDVVEVITNGRTPPRQSYTDEGLFVVKVGNLTGNGINWSARDRNFVDEIEKAKRGKNKNLMLAKGDIVLTAAAHSPIYIAKKVDIIDSIPEWVGGKASFVGEVMLIRPNQKLVDPYILLAYLRMPTTMEKLQMLIRGQTAHLYSRDVLDLAIPSELLKPDKKMKEIAELLRKESELNFQINNCAFEQQRLMEAVQV